MSSLLTLNEPSVSTGSRGQTQPLRDHEVGPISEGLEGLAEEKEGGAVSPLPGTPAERDTARSEEGVCWVPWDWSSRHICELLPRVGAGNRTRAFCGSSKHS